MAQNRGAVGSAGCSYWSELIRASSQEVKPSPIDEGFYLSLLNSGGCGIVEQMYDGALMCTFCLGELIRCLYPAKTQLSKLSTDGLKIEASLHVTDAFAWLSCWSAIPLFPLNRSSQKDTLSKTTVSFFGVNKSEDVAFEQL